MDLGLTLQNQLVRWDFDETLTNRTSTKLAQPSRRMLGS